MPSPFKPFITFSRNEKYGLLALTGLLLVLVLIRATMHFFIKPGIDDVQQIRLQQAWHKFQQTQTDTAVAVTQSTSMTNQETSSALVNINTADSSTLIDLDGIGPASAHKILLYRSHQHFTSFEQVRKLCRMSATNANLLKPHILIK